jgi:uncharacterized coiled-coil protein SlyX
VSEGAFIVAIIAVSVTFFGTAGGAVWALATRIAALSQKVEAQQKLIDDLRGAVEAAEAETRRVREEARAEVARLTTTAEVRRTEETTRWLSFTEKLATITGLLSAHPTPR